MTNVFNTTTHGARADFTYRGYSEAARLDLTSEALKSASVYGRNNESVGSISDLVVGDDGKISQAIIDVGGFLGMGARSVSMAFDDLTVLRETDGHDLRVYTDATKEQLEAMPRYDG